MAKRLICLHLVLLFGSVLSGESPAFADQPLEYEIKAAFLYNFAKFVTWPDWKFASEDSPIVIGILGDDPFGKAIDKSVEEKTIDGRPLRVERILNARDAKGIHLLFIGGTDEALIESALGKIDRSGLLVVGDAEHFAYRLGTIGFFMEENRVRFEVNVAAAESAGLKISSKLLQLARVIEGEKAGGR